LAGLLRDLAATHNVLVEDLPIIEPEVLERLRHGFRRTPDIRRLQSALAVVLARSTRRIGRAPH